MRFLLTVSGMLAVWLAVCTVGWPAEPPVARTAVEPVPVGPEHQPQPAYRPSEAGPRRIELRVLEPEAAVFPAPVRCWVSFVNDGQEPWVLPAPDRSAAVHAMHQPAHLPLVSQGRRLGGSFHCTEMEDGHMITTSLPPPDIAIPPGKRYSFDVSYFTQHFPIDETPGQLRLWIEYERGDERIVSPQVDVDWRFTEASVEHCLAVARDPDRGRGERRAAALWLQRLYPNLGLAWPPEGTVDADAHAQIIATLDAPLVGFWDWWGHPSHGDYRDAAIQAINAAAMQPPVDAPEQPAVSIIGQYARPDLGNKHVFISTEIIGVARSALTGPRLAIEGQPVYLLVRYRNDSGGRFASPAVWRFQDPVNAPDVQIRTGRHSATDGVSLIRMRQPGPLPICDLGINQHWVSQPEPGMIELQPGWIYEFVVPLTPVTHMWARARAAHPLAAGWQGVWYHDGALGYTSSGDRLYVWAAD